MIVYSYIEDNLRALDSRYQRGDNMDASFAAKLAILELCGWIEQSMDECILDASVQLLEEADNLKCIKKLVNRNYGFDYDRHFKRMIINLIGVWGFEKISKSVDMTVEINFKTELKLLMQTRNTLAHTYTRGIEPYDAPSVTLERLAKVKAGLEAYDAALREYYSEDDQEN